MLVHTLRVCIKKIAIIKFKTDNEGKLANQNMTSHNSLRHPAFYLVRFSFFLFSFSIGSLTLKYDHLEMIYMIDELFLHFLRLAICYNDKSLLIRKTES